MDVRRGPLGISSATVFNLSFLDPLWSSYPFIRDLRGMGREKGDYIHVSMSQTLLTIPYQAFEVNHVYVTPFQKDHHGKWLAQLSYKDPSIDFHDVCLMTPPLRVIDYQAETSRLRLDLSPHLTFQIKLHLFYEYLISTLYLHQHGFLHSQHRTVEDIRGMFYSLLDGSVLSLYIYPTMMVQRADGEPCRMTDLQTGDPIRCIIRFHGVSQLHHRDGMKLRLHHSVPRIWRM